jgi:hypothetical protein
MEQTVSTDEISAEDIDKEIGSVRAKTGLSGEEAGRRLEILYRQKSDILAGRRVERLPESVEQKIQSVRDDAGLTAEQKGEKLLELYRQKVSLEKAAQENEPPADPEAVSHEVETDLRNSWGDKFESRMNGIAQTVLDIFGSSEKFKAFSEKLKLNRDEQIDAMHHLADLAAPVPSTTSVEKTNSMVTQNLQSMWDSDADQRWGHFQTAARAIFGNLERCEDFFIGHGLAENPQAAVKAIVLLSRLGRKIKTETLTKQEEREPLEEITDEQEKRDPLEEIIAEAGDL